MKTTYIFLAFIAILMYNGFLAQHDQKMFDAHDPACVRLPNGQPNCNFAKTQ